MVLFFVVWFLIALAAGATGLTQRLHPPAPQIVLVALTAMLVTAGRFVPAFRAWVASLDWTALVAVHLTRFVGLYFLWLTSRGALPRAFAVPAAYGDIATALGASALLLLASRADRRPRLIAIWNAFGLVDILFVVASAATHALASPESMGALLRLPLSLLPTFLVPLIIATHVELFRRIATRTLAPSLAFLENRILDTVRREMARIGALDPSHAAMAEKPLRIARWAPLRAGITQRIMGFNITVLVDPKLGVPCDQPTAKPRWASPTALVMTVSARGDRLLPRVNGINSIRR
jgi:hypothetical protein